MNASRLVAAACLVAGCAWGAEVTAPSPEETRDKVQQEAWALAEAAAATLEAAATSETPGLRALLADFHRANAARAASAPPSRPDGDALATRNPHFWSAVYERHPGDPTLAVWHTAVLLASGEDQRAAALAAFGLQARPLPEDAHKALQSLLSGAQVVAALSGPLVREGKQALEAGNPEQALRKFDAALTLSPGNGWAHYERGFALRMQAMSRAGSSADPSVADPPEAQQEFALARKHDPFHLLAYQGADPLVVQSLMALVRQGLQVWEALRHHPEQLARQQHLEDLANACRDARADEYALVLRQLVIQRNTHHRPEDREFVAECLGRLAPEALPSTLERLAPETRLPSGRAAAGATPPARAAVR